MQWAHSPGSKTADAWSWTPTSCGTKVKYARSCSYSPPVFTLYLYPTSCANRPVSNWSLSRTPVTDLAVRTRQSTVWSGNVLRFLLDWVLRDFPCLSKRISAYDVATVHGHFLLRPYLPSIRGNLPILFDANLRCSRKNTWQTYASIYYYCLFAFYFMHLQVSDNIAFMVRLSVVVVVCVILYYQHNHHCHQNWPFCFYCGWTVPVRISTRDLVYASGAILWFYSVSPDKQ
jgi:hypothetical protein